MSPAKEIQFEAVSAEVGISLVCRLYVGCTSRVYVNKSYS